MPISANQFKNMNELIQYLNDLEQRINIVEEQNLALRTSMEELNGKNRELVEFLKDSWPKTSLFHRSFWVRAWTIFGHNLVIQLIIGVFFFILYLVFLAPMIASMLQQVPGLLQ
jgi:hypothetical protein